MSDLVARTGRDRQRYEDNLRLVSGCIPYRLAKHSEDESIDLDCRVEVLMISSPNREDLVFPKGGWEDDETLEEAACREALEEAGVRGILKGNHLGVWEFRSKSRQDLCSLEGGCKGYMFALEVTEELDVWPEQGNRDRKWLFIKEAFELCRYEWMRRALEEFLGVLVAEERKNKTREDVAVMEEHPHPTADVAADCHIVPSNCHPKPPSVTGQHHNVSPMNSSNTAFGIMLPAGIFLYQ